MSTTTNETSVRTASSSDMSSANTDPLQHKVLTFTFNQDSTALTMGTEKSYFLFAINQKNKIGETNNCGIESIATVKYIPFEEVRIVERVFSSSLLALVSNQEPRKLNVIDIRRGVEIYANKFPTNILAVKMNRSRIVVCLEEVIWIFDKTNLKTLYTIREIPSNLNGLCALSSKNESPYLAYPGSSTIGKIQIFNTIKLEQGVTINAHNGPVVAMSFDMSGERIASASDKGTVVRVHSAVDGSRLFELRRGVRRAATIYSLAFSPDSMFLAASSNTGTIHIFRLMNPTASASEEPGILASSVSSILWFATYLIPKQPTEVWTQDRSFATVHLKSGAMKTTIAMNVLNEKLILFVAAYDAVFSTYEVNITDGGECPQICNQYLLSNVSVTQKSTATNSGQNAVDEPVGIYPPNLFKNDNESVLNPSSSTKDSTS